jgi:hypothetical protein
MDGNGAGGGFAGGGGDFGYGGIDAADDPELAAAIRASTEDFRVSGISFLFKIM